MHHREKYSAFVAPPEWLDTIFGVLLLHYGFCIFMVRVKITDKP